MLPAMKLGIDLDGCVYDFTGSFLTYLREIDWFFDHGLPDPGPDYVAPEWNFFTAWGMSGGEFARLCNEGVDAGVIFSVGDPIEGSVETLNALREDGHSIHIITHRKFGRKSISNTEEWLHRHGVPFDTITFAEDKTIVGVDLLIDDYEENWRASMEQGILCVMMHRPWNEHVHEAASVRTWPEFRTFVNALRFHTSELV